MSETDNPTTDTKPTIEELLEAHAAAAVDESRAYQQWFTARTPRAQAKAYERWGITLQWLAATEDAIVTRTQEQTS